jgi:hypothetical protein
MRFLEILLNWWAPRPSNILIPGTVPGSMESVSVLPREWIELSWVMVIGYTVIPIIISILICYMLTRAQGKRFLMRWWIFLFLTALFDAIMIYIFLSSKAFAFGTAESMLYWKLPAFMVLNRTIVGFCQTILYYYLFSILIVKVLGGIFNFPKFRLNLAYPFPNLFRA